MIRILVAVPLDSKAIDLLNEIPEFEINEKTGLTPGRFLDEIRNADALVCGGSPRVTGKVLDAGSDLKLIIHSGQDSANMEEARRRHIEVRRITAGRAAGDEAIAVLKDFFNA